MKDLFNNKQELDSMRERFSMLGIVEDLETMRGEERDYDVSIFNPKLYNNIYKSGKCRYR